MKYRIALAVACCFAAITCGKKEPASPPAPVSAAQPDDSASTDSLPARTVAETAASGTPAARNPSTPENEAAALEGAIHPFMTSQLRLFIQEKGRLPENLGEFTTARMDSVPRPPPGMEYVIDANAQAVKVVRKSRK